MNNPGPNKPMRLGIAALAISAASVTCGWLGGTSHAEQRIRAAFAKSAATVVIYCGVPQEHRRIVSDMRVEADDAPLVNKALTAAGPMRAQVMVTGPCRMQSPLITKPDNATIRSFP